MRSKLATSLNKIKRRPQLLSNARFPRSTYNSGSLECFLLVSVRKSPSGVGALSRGFSRVDDRTSFPRDCRRRCWPYIRQHRRNLRERTQRTAARLVLIAADGGRYGAARQVPCRMRSSTRGRASRWAKSNPCGIMVKPQPVTCSPAPRHARRLSDSTFGKFTARRFWRDCPPAADPRRLPHATIVRWKRRRRK